ncbi:MAG: hypothetical protein ACT4NY_33960 [Pseudonocardiales bacterium]
MMWTDLGGRSGPEYMESFCRALDRLDQGEADGAEQTARLARAMANLVGLAVRLYQEPDADWVAHDLPEFRVRARDLLARHRPILSRYLGGMETAVWSGTPQDWYTASVRRSAIQTVMAELDRDGDSPLIELQRILDDDDDMREAAADIEPLPPDAIPPLPPTHWWWRIPEKLFD